MNKIICIFVAMLGVSALSSAQIYLDNPSFESSPREGGVPNGWQACGFLSTPDCLPGVWNVTTPPAHGRTYIGLTAREDNTWEAIGQPLNQPLKANECYHFSLQMARSDTYSGFNKPIRLRVWGGKTICQKEELLTTSPVIIGTSWRKQDFYFFPKKGYNFIIFEAYYADGTTVPYRGNLLIDNCSPITICIRASTDEALPAQF